MAVFSIIKKSELEEQTKRIDAEYYQPRYLDYQNKLKSTPTFTITDIASSVVNFGAYSLTSNIEWQESGIPYLYVENIKDGYIDFENTKFINEKVHQILKKSAVQEGQILITMAGTIGNVAVAHKISGTVNSNQAIAKITLKPGYSPYFLAAFLGCSVGKSQTLRNIISSVQANIFLWQIKALHIPDVSKQVQDSIERIYIEGLNTRARSRTLYLEAEQLLLDELGIKESDYGYELSYVVSVSEADERVDAEYFQPKYKKLLEKIREKKSKKLGDLVSVKKGIEPGSETYQDEGKTFIRVSSLSKFGIQNDDQKYLTDELYNKLKKNYEPQQGEILLTKDATPGIAYVISEPVEGIISGGILRLKLKDDIDPEYLALCINSLVGQMQAERDAGGSIIKHWKPDQIKNIEIPILPKAVQEKIGDLVRKSHEVRKTSKELLDQAKQEVEQLIENA